MELYKLFENQHKKLEENNFYLFPLPFNYNQLKEVQREKFFKKSDETESYRGAIKITSIEEYERFEDLGDCSDALFSSRRARVWMVQENEEPCFNPNLPVSDDLLLDSLKQNDMILETLKSIDIKSVLHIPNFSKIKTFEGIVEAYQSMTTLSQSLPFFLYAIKQSGGNFVESNKLFAFLSKIYIISRNSLKSFPGPYIATFIDSFEQLCSLLNQSGIKMTELKSACPDFEKKIIHRERHNDYIISIETIQFLPPPTIWTGPIQIKKSEFREVVADEMLTEATSDFVPIEIPEKIDTKVEKKLIHSPEIKEEVHFVSHVMDEDHFLGDEKYGDKFHKISGDVDIKESTPIVPIAFEKLEKFF